MAHHIRRKILPFTAILGQDTMKNALILNVINPRIGGVLIRGEKGTAKSTAVRALAELLPEIEVVNGCTFNCNPYDAREMCDLCYVRPQLLDRFWLQASVASIDEAVYQKERVVDSDLAVEMLKKLPTGGRTPLAVGLEQGLNLLMAKKHRDEEAIPILLLISDGRANVPAGGSKELEQELLALAEQARAKGIYVVVIDTEIVSDSFIQMQLGYCCGLKMM
jgi:hypothetical protein